MAWVLDTTMQGCAVLIFPSGVVYHSRCRSSWVSFAGPSCKNRMWQKHAPMVPPGHLRQRHLEGTGSGVLEVSAYLASSEGTCLDQARHLDTSIRSA